MSESNAKVTRDEKAWEVEVQAEIPAERLTHFREETLKEMQRDAKLDGFRQGKAPIERILQIYGEETVMRRAAEHAIQHELPEILAKENVLVIESPRVTTDTPIIGKPLPFTARAALAPSITLPDYKAVAKKNSETKEDTTVTDEEFAQAMTHIRREKARIDKVEAGMEPPQAAEEARTMEEKDLPTLDDAFAGSVGYENAETFAQALRENIKNEKELRAQEKRRQLILDDLTAQSKISYPLRLREYELDDMESRLKDDLARLGQTIETYLAQTKKTIEQIRTEWQDAADKRVKVRLILAEIARKENIQPESEAL
jgi:trigger factor